jgi:hypothetical protein
LTTNTGFVITDAGNAAATVATPTGPFINITQFRVYDSYNWIPDGTEVTLPGNLKFTGGVTNYYVVDYDTIELILFMDGTVGPFQFGTIGIYLQDGTLFATCVFDTLQEKIRAVGNSGGTQWRVRARLKLARASVICQVDVITTTQILEVSTWPFLVTPGNQVGNANMAIVTGEQDTAGDSILVYKDSVDQWAINDYDLIFSGDTDGGGVIGVSSVSHPGLVNVTFTLPQTNSRYLIRFPDGDIRRVTSITGTTQLNYASPKAVSQTGTFTVWEDNNTARKAAIVRWAARYEYNRFVTDFNVHWSVPSGSFSGSNRGSNQTAIPQIAAGLQPTYQEWKDLQDKVIAKCKIHGVAQADIMNMDYVYSENNVNGWGLQYIKENWDILNGKLPLISTAANTWDPAYQESTVPVDGTSTRVQPWGSTGSLKTHTITFTYADANTFKGLVNSGHQISINASVATGANANWLDIKNFLTAMGTITIGAGDTTVSGSGGTPAGIGLQELTGVYQELYTRTATISGGPFTVTVFGRITGGNIVDIKCTYMNTGTGYYASGVNDLFTSAAALRRPSSTILQTPVLAYPAVTQTSDF